MSLACGLFLVHSANAQDSEEAQRFRLARGYEESGDMAHAGRLYLDLYLADSTSDVYFDGLVRTYARQGRHRDLLPYAAGRAGRFPRDIALQSLHASLLYRSSLTSEAARAWSSAMNDVSPREEATYAIVAQSQVEAGALDLAIKTWRTGRVVLRSKWLFAMELARAMMKTGDIEGGIAEYIHILDFGRDELPGVLRALSSATVGEDGVRRMINVVSEASNARADFEPLVNLLGWLYQEVDDVDGAFRCAVRLDSMRGSNGSELFRFADAMLRSERFDVALAALERFLSSYPRSNVLTPLASLACVRALEGMYRSSKDAPDPILLRELVARFGTLIDENPDSEIGAEARLRLAQIELHDLRDISGAMSVAGRLITQNPRWQPVQWGRLLFAELLIRGGRLDEGSTLLTQLSTSDRQVAGEEIADRAQVMRAEMAFFAGEFQAAADMFLGLTNDPASDVANDALEYLMLIREYSDHDATALKAFAHGRLLSRQLRWNEAEAALVDGARLSVSTALADRCNYECAMTLLAAGKTEKGVEMLLQVATTRPNGLLADRALYEAARTTERDLHDRARARLLYERLVNDYSNSPCATTARERAAALRAD